MVYLGKIFNYLQIKITQWLHKRKTKQHSFLRLINKSHYDFRLIVRANNSDEPERYSDVLIEVN